MLASLGLRCWKHLIVKSLHEHNNSTKIVLVHRTQLCSSDPIFAFTLCRRRFAITMNKTHGQDFNVLQYTYIHRQLFFPLCQLYMVFSQFCSFDTLSVAVIELHLYFVHLITSLVLLLNGISILFI
jgi:hypothetical protein